MNKSNFLKEENIIQQSKRKSNENSINKDIKEYFPSDNDSVDTNIQSKILTSKFKNKSIDKKEKRKKKSKLKLNPIKNRENNFDIKGLVNSKMMEYNSLKDQSLKKFFCSPEKVKHMTKVGLITKNGLIIKNPEIYLKMKKNQKVYQGYKLPSISRNNNSEKDILDQSLLSEKDVKQAIRAKSLKAKKKLHKGLSPLGQIMFKENKNKIRNRNKKKNKKKSKISKKKFENYLRQVENLYNIK